jgi:hypothetical protein
MCLSLLVAVAPGCGGVRGGGRVGAAAPADAAVDPRTLGRVEAIAAFCAGLGGGAPEGQAALVVPVVAQAPERARTEARGRAAYRESYGETRAALDGVPRDEAQAACHELGGVP